MWMAFGNPLFRLIFAILLFVRISSGKPWYRSLRPPTLHWHPFSHGRLDPVVSVARAGSGSTHDFDDPAGGESISTDNEDDEKVIVSTEPPSARSLRSSMRKVRYSSDMIDNLHNHDTQQSEESAEFRALISSRKTEYLEELEKAILDGETNLPHPKRLLHYLAPRVPAIRRSPDINLRIRSSMSSLDAGLAACIIATVAEVCETYDSAMNSLSLTNIAASFHSIADEIIQDRRFEQLVECVVCGVDIEKRKREWLNESMGADPQEKDIEEVLADEIVPEGDGICVRDACRAAWGLAILEAHLRPTLGGEKVRDILVALALQAKGLLLAQIQALRQEDIAIFPDVDGRPLSPREILSMLSEALAEDAAGAMWAFACVKACVGLKVPSLFQTSSSILCQDVVEMRKRAQEDTETAHVIGGNDVVDELAFSQLEGDSVKSEEPERDSLLDWLSPYEVNDVMWSLALHGTDDSIPDEIELSETASALREIAFDRMIEWLEEDRVLRERRRQNVDAELVTVEVVDAATLLKAEVEELRIDDDLVAKVNGNEGEVSPGDRQEILLDAEYVMAAERDQLDDGGVTATIEDDKIQIRASFSNLEATGYDVTQQLFNGRDLSSIAWSVTELRDPLMMQIMEIVTDIIADADDEILASLNGSDLSNIAWAVAKYADDFSIPPPKCAAIFQRITRYCQKYKSPSSLLKDFQAPELGRLVWAVASTVSPHEYGALDDGSAETFAVQALLTAGTHLSRFSTEDLLRVLWGFLELASPERLMTSVDVSVSLGRTLATIEESLYEWEHGSRKRDQEAATGNLGDAAGHDGFFSFFGKSLRLHRGILQHKFGEDEDEESGLAPLLAKSSLPLLRDLPVDPSTLCRAACGFARLTSYNPDMRGSWTLVRVAVRLLSSKDARLLKECSIHDVIRLCEACVLSEGAGHGRELVIGLFARKVVQLLNNELSSNLGNSEKKMNALNFETASPAELSKLIWSLGQLGVRHVRHHEDISTAHRRMLLVSEAPLLQENELVLLEMKMLVKLLKGAVAMNFMNSDKKFLVSVVTTVDQKMNDQSKAEDICDLVESIASIRTSLQSHQLDISQQHSKTLGKTDLGGADESCGDVGNKSDDISDLDSRLRDLCDDILFKTGEYIQQSAKHLPPSLLRRVLVVYAMLPFQHDGLIQTVSDEVQSRLSTDDAPLIDMVGIPNALAGDISSIDNVLEEVEVKGQEDQNVLDGIKHSLMSFFHKESETKDKEELKASDNTWSTVVSLLSGAVESQNKHSRIVGFPPSVSVTRATQQARFELGRCNQLIESYRRIDFETGNRKGRFDSDRNRVVAKRVLSRLLPNK